MTAKEARESILEIQVNAALTGHDLGPFEQLDTVTGGYQAECRKCGETVWVGDSGVMYSILAERCPELPQDAG